MAGLAALLAMHMSRSGPARGAIGGGIGAGIEAAPQPAEVVPLDSREVLARLQEKYNEGVRRGLFMTEERPFFEAGPNGHHEVTVIVARLDRAAELADQFLGGQGRK